MANFSSHFFPVSVTLTNLFGDAAVKNVGTTPFTVAAGDDFRILAGYNAYTTVLAGSANWVEPSRRFDFVQNSPQTNAATTYTGVATANTSISAAAWRIQRIVYTIAGLVSSNQIAQNVSWTNRYTLSSYSNF